VRIDWFQGSREALADLFALADESPAAVARYRDLGRVLVARDGPELVGHLQLIAGERAGEAELKSLAVREDRQGQGVGRLLVNRAVAVSREEGLAKLNLSTSPADARVLHFYQRLGFRLARVVRDVFTPEAGYASIEIDGVPLRDQVWLSLALRDPDPSASPPQPMQLRVARHTERLDELVHFYRDGLGLIDIGGFAEHDGYAGVFLEVPGTGAHVELTAGGEHGGPVPHPESLLVLYLGDRDAVQKTAARLGVDPVMPANPYWAEHGLTFEDPDGFRVVLVPEGWRPSA
jgi:GNAT superfamily N-acetyltransferase